MTPPAPQLAPEGMLSPAQAAKVIGHGRDFVMALIAARELPATNEHAPGTKRPRYRIDPRDLEAWRRSRDVRRKDNPLTPAPKIAGVTFGGYERRRRKREQRRKLVQA